MGCITPVYRPRDAEHTVLHQVVAEHLEAFLSAVAESGDSAGLPQFAEREFREFLLCGVYEAGVARFQCEGCAREHRDGRHATCLDLGRRSRRAAGLALETQDPRPPSIAGSPALETRCC